MINLPVVESQAAEIRRLLDRARAGDAEAFGEVCRAYGERLMRHAWTLCGNAAAAEEMAEETLVEAWKHLDRFEGRCEFFTWLCAILLRRWRNAIRRKRPIPFSSLGAGEQDAMEGTLAQLADPRAAPDCSAAARDEAAIVLQCVESLPAKYRQIVYLRFYVDESLESIAAALGCSVGTVKSRLFRALERLRGMRGFRDA